MLPAYAARTAPLPPQLLSLFAASPSGGDAGPLAALSAPAPQVHVFWDVASAHPGDADPRIPAAEVLSLARRLGSIAGAYAYAPRAVWAWVPSFFVRQYGQPGGPAEAADVSEAGQAGSSAARPRCAVCGQPVAASHLEAHMRRQHPDQADTAPGGAQRAAVEGSLRRTRAGDSGGPAPPAHASKALTNTHRTGLGAVAEYFASNGERFTPPAGIGCITGSGVLRAVGRSSCGRRTSAAAEAQSQAAASGWAGPSRAPGSVPSGPCTAVFYPQRAPRAAGHQLTLKYVVAREGFDARVAQNSDEASDRALNGGIDRLLAALRAVKSRPGGGALGGVTLVLVSGSQAHAAALEGCRRLGVRTVLVAPRGKGPGAAALADAALDWDALAAGALQL